MHLPGPVPIEEPPSQAWIPDLRLQVELPRWHQTFFNNLRDLIRPSELSPLELTSAPAPFWPDVFVKRGLPWRRFVESAGYHVVAFAMLVSFTRFLELHPQPTLNPTFDHAQVIYYQPTEYLPPFDTRRADAAAVQRADPEFSRQPIISLPPETDNRSQTVVTAPDVKLRQNVPLPNMVAWSDKPDLPVAPAPLVPAASISRISPRLETPVVAPPPDLPASSKTAFQAPQPAVIEPPPSVASTSTRPPGELNIARTAVIAPAPQLPVGEQRTIPGAATGRTGLAPEVVPPPPSLAGSSSSTAGGRVIALNLHPAVGAPPVAPLGNRRGAFAATPEGRPGGSGIPGAASGSTSAGTNGSGTGRGKGEGNGSGSGNASSGLPAGLYVGSAADPAKSGPLAGNPAPKRSTPAPSVNPKLMASVPPPRVSKLPLRSLQSETDTKLSEPERAVFGTRRFYSLTLNMPNLNSSGGSWVIRFAELKQNSTTDPGSLSAPAATRKVDPAYPLELMRQNVAGVVILYAVIHADGSVGNVRVLRGVDERLDQFASQALSRWQFDPATKNGSPVDVEATFQIPFRSVRPNF
jgi:TonB family protein